MLNTLIIILFIEFMLAFIVFKSDLLSPAILLSGVFLVAAIILLPMQNYWALNLKPEAVNAIAAGNGSFICMSILMHWLHLKKPKRSKQFPPIYISNSLITFFALFYVGVVVVYLLFVWMAARRHGASGNVFSMVGYIQNLSEDEVGIPSIIYFIYNICINLTYLWVYVFARNFRKTRIRKNWLVLLVVSYLMGLFVNGSRGEFVGLIIYTISLFIIIYRKENQKKIPRKYYIRVGIGIVAVILLFQGIGTFMGRDSGRYGFTEYISIYVGAPIMNFSNTLYTSSQQQIFGAETFHKLHEFLSSIFGYEVPKTTRLFWVANGHNVGNVATMYYDYYHDFGMIGCIVLPILMAYIMQSLYERTTLEDKKGISLLTMTYCWTFFQLLRSFFSNTLINNMFSFSFIKQYIVWATIAFLITKARIKSRIAINREGALMR